jgi:hypothetical protein
MKHLPNAQLLTGLRLGRHNGSGTSLYAVYCQIVQRCCNAHNKDFWAYGGRGIRICRRWRNSYAAFRSDMGPRPSPEHTVDRRDSDGDYCPDNCRWATPTEQAAHRRRHCPLPGQLRLPFMALPFDAGQ